MGGTAHHGIMHSAQNILDAVLAQLLELHSHYAPYGIKVVGHSLGAGTVPLIS